ncbi:MAG: hypothetical protein JW976_11875 [Syntrophaceae bacterium]|nr:hypothetical protein [Syntrophaceae bacterium]
MKTIADTIHKTDEKKDFTPDELAKAKITCEFVIDLIKAISRSGYYDAHHPVSMEVKKGLYGALQKALGHSSEIMLTCHEYEDKVDIHISGILDQPFNVRKLTHAVTSDLFIPKLQDYFERKSLNSFVIKKNITPQHFESFIDIMSEPILDSADTARLGEYLTEALAGQDITEVSTIFKTDIVLSRGKLPWRVSIILRRLAKDLKVVPMFHSASAAKMKLIKKQIVEDIIRPLNNFDLLKDLITNCDIIVDHITHLLEVDELENLIISSLPTDAVMPVSSSVFEVYEGNKTGISSDEDVLISVKREVYLAKVLNIAAQRIVAEKISGTTNLLERLYENEIIDFEMLPEKLRFDIQSKKIADYVISEIDDYIEKALNAEDPEDMESNVAVFKRVIPHFIKQKEWGVIKRIMETLQIYSSRCEGLSERLGLLSNMPDSVFEGSEEALADGFIHAGQDLRKQINDVLTQMSSKCMDVANIIFSKGKEPDVLKNTIELISKKSELARKWAIKILDEQNQPLALMNIALLVITNAGHSDDVTMVKRYINNSNSSIRVKALMAIAKMNMKDAEGVAINALSDGEEKVRNQAASLIEHELSLSGESVNRVLSFVKEKLQNRDITANEAGFISSLLRAIGKFKDSVNKESLENEIIGIASDLMHEKKGLLKFIKTELGREQEEIIGACASVLGNIGGIKSKEYLKTLLNKSTALSHAAKEAIAEIDKQSAIK